ncbi:MAG: hypothetical protein FJX72_09510, partial [Armatimonadetes bacterium]|nr:hypothetical protein [Armatimonadota bacterium]
MRLRIAILFGVLLLVPGVAIALAPSPVWLRLAVAIAAWATAWALTDRLVSRRVAALADAVRQRPESAAEAAHRSHSSHPSHSLPDPTRSHPPASESRSRMANDRDELGAIARAFDALNTSLCGREALLHDAEQTIEHNEARYRDLFDANPHPMLVFDTESLDILAANDMAVTGYGFSRSQFLRMTVRHLL